MWPSLWLCHTLQYLVSSLQLCAPWARFHAVSVGSCTIINRQHVSCSLFLSFCLSFFLSVVPNKHKPPLPGLAFLKCQKNFPKAYQPVKLSQTCKTEPLMKYINLEHWASIFSIVLFAYKSPWGKREWREGRKRKDTLDKIIFEKSLKWLDGWNMLIHCSIFFKEERDEMLFFAACSIPWTK